MWEDRPVDRHGRALQMLLRCAIQVVMYEMSEDKEYIITTCAKLKYLHSNQLLPTLTRLLTEPLSFHTPQSSLLFPWLPPREPCPLKQQHIFSSLKRNSILYCAIGNLQRTTHGTYILLNMITKYQSNSSVI